MSKMLLKYFPSVLQDKTRISSGGVYVRFIEEYVEKHTVNSYENRPVTVAGETDVIEGRVGAVIGKGVFGCVYEVSLLAVPPSLRETWPDLFEGGEFSDNLVIKFPNRISDSDEPVVDRVNEIFRDAISSEYRETREIEQQLATLGIEPIAGAKICFFGRVAETPVLLKKKLHGQDVRRIASMGDAPSEEQMERLKTDIFDKAHALFSATGRSLDIRPENLIWNTQTLRWQMIELTFVSQAISLCSGEFIDYLAAFEKSLRKHSP
ncbi:MAG: hypothetical protein A4E61_01117 [Syntrophorhabdus sp. PtaB.Bin184]|nr:MAG: hypothetical protein A4E61_01117 [Syntrophorhabdus sp. PtaB.Bin184]